MQNKTTKQANGKRVRFRASVILFIDISQFFKGMRLLWLHYTVPLSVILMYGFFKLLNGLRRQGYPWNHKRIHRIYCQMNWNKKCKVKPRLPNRYPEPLKILNSLK